MSRFPHLPETFILREMTALAARGWDVRLYPLMRMRAEVVHDEARAWTDRARYLSVGPAALLAANAVELARAPLTYLSLWAAVLRGCAREPSVLVRSLALLPACVRLAAAVRRDGVGHVHAHYATYPLLAAWVAHRLTGVSYSVTVHAHDIFTSTAMLDVKLRDVRFVAAISRYNVEHVARLAGPQVRERTHVIHCGVVPSRYEGPPRDTGAGLRLLSIGSLQLYKGQAHLVEACRLLVERGVDVTCRIVGAGPEQEALQRAIDAARLSGRVLLLGPRTQDEVAALLGQANCYAQPSVVAPDGQMEGIPVSIMEALASRLPVVASDLSGIPELVRPGETGWLVPPADAPALADALAEMAANPAEAARRADAGRHLVEQEFDLRRNVEELAALLAARAAPPRPATIPRTR
jgi:colanic acid/amylovoran biosynthesis glycosyltransferase